MSLNRVLGTESVKIRYNFPPKYPLIPLVLLIQISCRSLSDRIKVKKANNNQKNNKTHKHLSLASTFMSHISSSAKQGLMKPADKKKHMKRRQSVQFILGPAPYFTCTYLFSHKVLAIAAMCLSDSALAHLSNFLTGKKSY